MSTSTQTQEQQEQTPYQLLGEAAGIRRLVDRFYELMDTLPEAYAARKIHPDSLSGSAQSLFEFLSGWFGGPPLYVNRVGHPRLRMRHLPYTIGLEEREAWMVCMTQAIEEQVQEPSLKAWLLRVFGDMADHMINVNGH